MSYLLQKSLVLLLCLSLALATQCPITVQASRFAQVTGDTLTQTSDFYDAFYEIKLNSVGGSYILSGYKITEVDNLANTGFEAQQFTTPAQSAWKVLAISQLGNCVVIDNRPNLMAFDTSAKSFRLAQNLAEPDFVSGKVNDDCSIVRLTLADKSQKVFTDNTTNTQIVFPANSLFDSYFIYGIVATGSLQKVQATGLVAVNLDASALKDTPVSIMNRVDLHSLILVTSNGGQTEYAVTVVNSLSDSKAYSKEWTSATFTGEFKAQLSSEGSFVLLKDDSGFLMLLQIEYLATATTPVKVTEIALEDEKYKSLFVPESVISLTQNAVVVYLNGKLTYFQPYEGNLYYLAQIVQDLELEAIRYANSSEKTLSFTSTYLYTDSFETCEVFPKGNSTGPENYSQVDDPQIDAEEAGTATDDNGIEIQCAPECLTCTGKGVCKVCFLGYTLSDEGQCIFCEGCRSCLAKSPEQCLTCFKPYVLNPGTKTCGKQVSSDPLCLDSDMNGNCVQCPKGYSTFKNVCAKCQDGCDSCKNAGEDTCDEQVLVCKEGFVFYPTPARKVKYSCVECANGCAACQKSDISVCTDCIDGYFNALNSVTSKMACASCLQNCLTCTTATACTKCESGYKLNSDNTKCIQKCDDTCLTCSQTDKTECKTCYGGSKLSGTSCVADLSCNTAKTCSACGEGYALKTGECVQCQTGDNNCLGCSPTNINVCTICASGYYINAGRKCVKCSSECKTCQNDQACMSCTDGYYLSRPLLSATGRCLACRSTCKTCLKNPYICTSCRNGFSLEGTKCLNQNRVDYTATVTADVSLVVVLARTFITVLIETAQKSSLDKANPLKLTTDDITMNDITKGSAVLKGSMSTGSAAQSAALSSNLGDQLSGVELQSGFTILGVEIKTVAPKTVSEGSLSTNLGLILGVAIPISLIVLIGLIVIVFRLRKRRQDMQSNRGSSYGDYVNDSQKNVKGLSEETDKV